MKIGVDRLDIPENGTPPIGDRHRSGPKCYGCAEAYDMKPEFTDETGRKAKVPPKFAK